MLQTDAVNNIPIYTYKKDTDAFGLILSFATGSLYELNEREFGHSHFLEHIVFNRTKSFDSINDLITFCEINGISFNAVTSSPYTSFFFDGHKDNFSKAFEVLQEIICSPLINDELVDYEKQIILQELSNSKDNIQKRIHHHILDKYYNNPLFHDALGSEKSIVNTTAQSLLDYKRTHYTLNNIHIGLTGNFEIKEFTKKIKNSGFIELPTGQKQSMITPNKDRSQYDYVIEDVDQKYVTWTFTSPQTTVKNYVLHKFVKALLGGINGSYLMKSFRLNENLSYYTGATHYIIPGSDTLLVLLVSINSDFEDHSNILVNDILKSMHNFEDDVMFTSAKNMMLSSLCFKDESTHSRMNNLAENHMLYGEPIYYEDLIKQINALTKEDIKKYSRQYLINPKITVIGKG